MTVPVVAGLTPADARLAWELVANISPLGDIMRRHGLSFDDYDEKKRDPIFKAAVQELTRHWNSDLSVTQRIQLKAALLTEDSLLDIYAMVKDKEVGVGNRLEAFGALAKAGEVGTTKKDVGAGAPTVKVVINVPGKTGVTVDATPVEIIGEMT